MRVHAIVKFWALVYMYVLIRLIEHVTAHMKNKCLGIDAGRPAIICAWPKA